MIKTEDRPRNTNFKLLLFVNKLPKTFSSREAVEIGAKIGISKRTTFYWLKGLIVDKVIKRGTPGHFEKIKEQVTLSDSSIKFDEDIKSNKATLEYTGPKEVKTKEDLIRECNIDLSKYTITRMIHNAWGKEGNQNYQVKAWLEPIVEKAEDVLAKVIQEFSFHYKPSAPVFLNKVYDDKTCAVLSLQDIHIGKQYMDGVHDIGEVVKACVQSLIMRSYHSCCLDKIFFVIGGDLINVDTFLNTTTSGTQVESSMSALQMYREAFELMFWAINYIKQFCSKLEVVYIPGNHDRLSSGQLTFSLSKVFNDPNIIWNIDYAERKAIKYGINMLCFEHGDFDTKKSFFVFSTEYPEIWGSTKFRTVYTGHYHKKKTLEYITEDEISGFQLKILPSLSKPDYYHSSNKWTGNRRGGIIDLHSHDKGMIGGFTHYV